MTRPPRGGILFFGDYMKTKNEGKTTYRNDIDKKHLKTRLKTIEGQLHGISLMIDDDRYCNDILIQISAASKSLKSLGNEILKNHLETCLVREIKADNYEIISEVMELIRRLNS